MTTAKNERFLAACRREQVDRTPIWLMRQAGRSLPAYRALRSQYSFEALQDTPELCAQVTLMPLEVLDVDAAILFADIMTPVKALGIDYQIVEGIGPVVAEPIASLEQITSLVRKPVADSIPNTFAAIGILKKELSSKVPLIGFAGAPFTLASYLIEGRSSRDLLKTKTMMLSETKLWDALMEVLTDMLIDYMSAQVGAGVQALQLFDSWVGTLSPAQYRENVLPHVKRLFDQTASLSVPRIHFGTGTAGLLADMSSAGSEVMGIDWRISIDEAWERVGRDRAIQGNLDPAVMFGSADQIVTQTREILERVAGRPGHIFNLGHGVHADTSLDALGLLIETVQTYPIARSQP